MALNNNHFYKLGYQPLPPIIITQATPVSDYAFPTFTIVVLSILATLLLLLAYFTFLTKCCSNWHQVNPLRWINISVLRARENEDPFIALSPTMWNRGLDESTIREIPSFQFIKGEGDDHTVYGCVGDEIPEEELPEPFSRPKLDHPLTLLNGENADDQLSMPSKTPIEDDHLPMPVKTPIEVLNQQPAVASYMSQGFRKHFSQKSKKNVADNVEQIFPSDSFQPSALPVSESSLKKNLTSEVTQSHSKSSPSKLASEAASSETCSTLHTSSVCFTSSSVTLATPSKTSTEHTEIKDGPLKSKDAMSTPAKLLSTPIRLMTETPALLPSKRHLMTPDDNCSSSPNKLVRGPSRSRSLKFDTPVKSEHAAAVGALSNDDDISDILSDDLLQSISEKEKKAMEERDPAISQAKKRKRIIASLPKLFNMIHLLFHSRNRSVITREELISSIISNHCDIIAKSEIEEQLHLLLELVPEWISEKSSSSGDMLFHINKTSDPHTIRASLEEAK